MSAAQLPSGQEVRDRLRQRVGGRVRDLQVDVQPGRVILRGRTDTYHVKQVAQETVFELLPGLRLENAITVGGHGDERR